jgi:Mrp family chromosome partitioning ATPase
MLGALRSAVERGAGRPAGSLGEAPGARLPELPPDQRAAFGDLAKRVREMRLASGRPSVVVTAAETGEGKSLCAVGLAGALAQDPAKPVLLLDCDLRRPALRRMCGGTPEVGVEDVLEGRASIERALLPVDNSPALSVATVGGPREDAATLCVSNGMSALLESVHASFDITVIDTPAAAAYPDARHVARASGGVVVVARRAGAESVRRTVEALREAGGVVLGVVPMGEGAQRFSAGADGEARGVVDG